MAIQWSNLAGIRWKNLKGMKRDDVLRRVGLQERTPTSDFFTGLGLFAVGILIGAGLGMLFAPKPGAEIRGRLSETLRNRSGRIAEELQRKINASPAEANT